MKFFEHIYRGHISEFLFMESYHKLYLITMSKLQLKKELQKLTKEQLIEQITELYDSYKPVKEYYQ